MDPFDSGGTIGTDWGKNRPSFRYSRPSEANASGGPADTGPIEETEVWGDSRVHFWVVGREGRARRGHYVRGLGVREMEEVRMSRQEAGAAAPQCTVSDG